MLILLIESKRYGTYGDGNNYRLSSGYYITKQNDDVTISNEWYDKESDTDTTPVISFNLRKPYTPWVYVYLKKMLLSELWPAFKNLIEDGIEEKVESPLEPKEDKPTLLDNTIKKDDWKKWAQKKKAS